MSNFGAFKFELLHRGLSTMAGRVNQSKGQWQHPYVNVFKQMDVEIDANKNARCKGSVTKIVDRTIGRVVHAIRGHISSANTMSVPAAVHADLGLTGRYVYLQLQADPAALFAVHIECVTATNFRVRLSLSNMFKEIKTTGAALQLPCGFVRAGRWTILAVDVTALLATYLRSTFKHIRGFEFCASMLLRNVFTSDMILTPVVRPCTVLL